MERLTKRETVTETYAEKSDALALFMFATGLFGVACAVWPGVGATVVEILQLIIWNLT